MTELCETCIYGINRTGSKITCTNKYVRNNPDPYYCEFYDEISDDYLADMRKVAQNT